MFAGGNLRLTPAPFLDFHLIKMDPFQAKSVIHLAHARRETKKILLKLQRDSDGVIEDLDKSVEDKKNALTELIASIKPMVEAVEHTSKGTSPPAVGQFQGNGSGESGKV